MSEWFEGRFEGYPWECGDCLELEICPCGEHGWCDKFRVFVDRDDQNVCEDFEPDRYAIENAEEQIADAKAELADRMYDAFKDEQIGL